ncbi:hypothetical protein BCON_0093g00120 [Botryotinia convoluta]|uniref:Uncharacterized protein n=1 Tax=Botryotinia convoluta TaxID=54673 RepID=A0A4Z1I903_9HELO|nr:hypothetical protein BCON_0093g00120 [Botryotinia convoluta]
MILLAYKSAFHAKSTKSSRMIGIGSKTYSRSSRLATALQKFYDHCAMKYILPSGQASAMKGLSMQNDLASVREHLKYPFTVSQNDWRNALLVLELQGKHAIVRKYNAI